MRAKRYRPTHLQNGVVVQSGQDLRPKGALAPGQITRGPFRAIVLKTYVQNSTTNVMGLGIECEVILVRTKQIIPNARVVQPGGHGINSAAPWVPRPTSKATLAQLTLSATVPGEFPELSDFDGDQVLIDFVEGDPQFPVVVGALQHEQSNRKVRSSQGDEGNPLDPDPNAPTAALDGGWTEVDGGASRGKSYDEEYYVNHRGTEIRINRSGDVLIDTVGAFGSDDTEASPLTTGKGQVRVRLKDGHRFTVECNGTDVLEVHKDLTGAHVDVGEGATEKMVLGDTLKSVLEALTVPTGFGPSGTPLNAATFPTFLSAQHRVK